MHLEEKVQQLIKEAAPHLEMLPGVTIIHHLKRQVVVHMSSMGLRLLETSMEELNAMGTDYFKKFFNEEEAKEYVPQILGLLERNNDMESISFFQQVRTSEHDNWTLYLSSTRIFCWDDDGQPLLTITTAIPVEKRHHFTAKVERLLEENNFLRQHNGKYSSLTSREKQILRLTALGYQSSEIAKEIQVSEDTVKTHRRNVKKKIKAQNTYDVVKFAQAFGLV